MTIKMDRDAGCFVVHCDECSEHIETYCDDFNEAKSIAQEAGWRAYSGPDKKWTNSCPACVEDFAKRKKR